MFHCAQKYYSSLAECIPNTILRDLCAKFGLQSREVCQKDILVSKLKTLLYLPSVMQTSSFVHMK